MENTKTVEELYNEGKKNIIENEEIDFVWYLNELKDVVKASHYDVRYDISLDKAIECVKNNEEKVAKIKEMLAKTTNSYVKSGLEIALSIIEE